MTGTPAVDAAAALATALVLGGMAFFSFVVAPLVFRVLDRETAAGFMRAAFPRYYDTMAGAAAVAAVTAALRGPADGAIMAGVAAAFVALRFALLPALDRRRGRRASGDAGAEAAFRRLHGISMAVNLVQLAAVAVVMARLVS